MKKALITGITGQDGHHLTELLVQKQYKVFGLLNGQRNSRVQEYRERFPEVKLIGGDLTDFTSLHTAINEICPDEIYNLGAISFVGLSFQQPELTSNITGLGALRLLEAVRKCGLANTTRIYQASSSEMFGNVRETPQTEMTPFHPRSPYGVAKVFAHFICQNYREAYGMYISSGILFNHEGEHRGHEFVTRKITSNLAKIKHGKIKKFSLGDIEPKRDWGYAGDYVHAMWLMLQQEKPSDYVIATGETHSVREFLELAIKETGLNGTIDDYVEFDENLVRPSEVDSLIGNASKAKKELGWTPTVTFSELVKKMVANDLVIEAN
jgi:GDPmannose 4,6-dehydratase